MAQWETTVGNLSLSEDKGSKLRDKTPSEINSIKGSADKKNGAWVERTGFNYDIYNAKSREEREDAEKQLYTNDVPIWAASAKKYEWKDEFGDVAPPVPELELQLFRHEFINRQGKSMQSLEFDVTVESEAQVDPIGSFEDAGLHPVMLENIALCQYERPTPIQAYTIPAVLKGHDVIAVAQTGSGKTAAFMIPILSKLMGKAKKLQAPRPSPEQFVTASLGGVMAEPLVLVIAPTRELSVQTFDEARRLCYRSMLRPCVAYGGGPAKEQAEELRRGCDILIGTPGRLIDFLGRGNLVSLRRVKYTVIDEADEMVAPDWEEDLRKLMAGGDNNEDADHRYLMFSATFPKGARQLAHDYLDDGNIRIKVGRAGSSHSNITQRIVFTAESAKRDALRDLLVAYAGVRTIVFVNSKRNADFVDDFLYNNRFPSTSIHSDRTQREREDALRAFKTGKTPILVATGVSARGLDIYSVGHVVNYDLPSTDHGGIHEYIHRIGRTARIGNTGLATSFYNERDENLAPALVKILMETKQEIPDFLESFKPEEGAEINYDDLDEAVPDVGGGDEGGEWNAGGENDDEAGGWGATNGDDAWGNGNGAVDKAEPEVAAW